MIQKINTELNEKIDKAIEATLWTTFARSGEKDYNKYKLTYKKRAEYPLQEVNQALSFLSHFLASNDSEHITDCVNYIKNRLKLNEPKLKNNNYIKDYFPSILDSLFSNTAYNATKESLNLLIPLLDDLPVSSVNGKYDSLLENVKLHTKKIPPNSPSTIPDFIIDTYNFLHQYLISKSTLIPRLGDIIKINTQLIGYIKKEEVIPDLVAVFREHEELIKSVMMYQKRVGQRNQNSPEFEEIIPEVKKMASLSKHIFLDPQNIILLSKLITVPEVMPKTYDGIGPNIPGFNFSDLFENKNDNLREAIENMSMPDFYTLVEHLQSSIDYKPDIFALYILMSNVAARPKGFLLKPTARHSTKELMSVLKLEGDNFKKAIILFQAIGGPVIKRKFLPLESIDANNPAFNIKSEPSNFNSIAVEMLKLIKFASNKHNGFGSNLKEKQEYSILIEKKMLDLSVEAPSDEGRKFKI